MQNLVTVFGGSGFIGTQVVRALAKAGWRIRVAVRNPSLAYKMRLHGDVGQIDVVQMSALGADLHSPSKYARTKAEGEQAVLETVPGAAIVRPSVVFGPEDDFFNKFAAMATFSPALPLIGGGKTRFQPVAVGDVGQAIARLVSSPDARGIFELGGPAVVTFREVLEIVMRETGRRRLLAPIPFPIAELIGSAGDLASFVMKPPLTADQVQLLRSDNVVSGQHPGLAELGVTPTAMESVLPSYLYVYRKGGQYADQEDRALAAR